MVAVAVAVGVVVVVAVAPEMLEALYECEAYGAALAKADAPGVAPDWYALVKQVIDKAAGSTTSS